MEQLFVHAQKYSYLFRRMLSSYFIPQNLFERKRFANLIRESKASEDCVIYGSGPSINEIDTSPYYNCDAFFVNGTALHPVYSKHETKFNVLAGMAVHEIEGKADIADFLDQYFPLCNDAPCITPLDDKAIYDKANPSLLENIYFLRSGLKHFSDSNIVPSLLLGTYPFGNVLNFALQVAFIFGYRKVFLSGFDGTILTSLLCGEPQPYGVASDRCREELSKVQASPPRAFKLVIGWADVFSDAIWMQFILESRGRSVVNLAPNSLFTMFPSIAEFTREANQ